MDLHERQMFDQLLGDAGEAFVERVVQRCGGQERALAALRADRNGHGVWLDRFVEAVFDDWCLTDADGAAFVLRALRGRPLPAAAGAAVAEARSVEQALQALARAAFTDLLETKVLESMSRASVYG